VKGATGTFQVFGCNHVLVLSLTSHAFWELLGTSIDPLNPINLNDELVAILQRKGCGKMQEAYLPACSSS
jgi:hypothetical protein